MSFGLYSVQYSSLYLIRKHISHRIQIESIYSWMRIIQPSVWIMRWDFSLFSLCSTMLFFCCFSSKRFIEISLIWWKHLSTNHSDSYDGAEIEGKWGRKVADFPFCWVIFLENSLAGNQKILKIKLEAHKSSLKARNSKFTSTALCHRSK